ncbi:MAG: GumC family protein [Rhizobiaceae bacterium]
MVSGNGHNRRAGSLLSFDEADATHSEVAQTVDEPTSGGSGRAYSAADTPSRDEPKSVWSRLAARWKPASGDKEQQTPRPAEPAAQSSAGGTADYPPARTTTDHEGLNQAPPPRRDVSEPVVRQPIASPETPREQALWRPLIDPAAVFGEVWRSKRLIVGCAVLGAVLGVAVALSTPRTYSAATDILIDPREWAVLERDQGRGSLQADAALALIENQIRVMTSRPVLRETVNRLNLADDPEFNGMGSAGISPMALVGSLRQLLSFSGDGSEERGREALAINNLGRSLFVSRGGRTFVVSVGVTTTDSEKSALIANTLTDVYLDVSARLQAGSSGRAADELNSRLDELRQGVEQSERAVEMFKAENEIIDAQGRLITDDEITRLNDQLSQARARTVELRARAQSARDLDVTAVVNGSLPEQIASGSMTELRAQYTNLQLSADRLAVRLGPRHPELLSVTAQLRGAEQQIRTELSRIVASLEVDLSRAQQQEQDLSAELARLKIRQGDLGNELVTLRELEREAAAKRAVYETFLLRARETGEQRQLNTANVTIISEAVPPLLPSGVSRAVISAGGMLLGLLFGVGIAGARGAWIGMINPVARPQPDTVTNSVSAPTPALAPSVDEVAESRLESEPPFVRHPASADDLQATTAHEPLTVPAGRDRWRPAPYPVGSFRREQNAMRPAQDDRMASGLHDPDSLGAPASDNFDDLREGLRECRAAIEQLTRQRADRSRYGT